MTNDRLSAEDIRSHKGISFVGVTTCFWCYNKNGEFWLAKRSRNTRDEQGTWEPGGGGLKWGSTAEDNVIREVKEEYGATAEKITFLGYRDAFRSLADGTPTHWLGLDFAVLVDKKQMKINEPHMFDDASWFNLDELPQPLHSQIPVALEMYGDQLKKLAQN